MAQGEFTKEECDETVKAVDEMFQAIAQRKKGEYLGHLNDVLLFLRAAKAAAPNEKK